MRNLSQVQVKNGSSWEKICPFPVGYIYLSSKNTSPASIYGGTWSQLTDERFLRPMGSDENTSGGAETVTHRHWTPFGKENGLKGFSLTGPAGWSDGGTYALRAAKAAHSIITEELYTADSNATEASTYDETISIMPPWRQCFGWIRTA